MAIVKGKAVKVSKKIVFYKAASLTWDQFTSTTTIHGLKHINDPRGTKATKIFWILVPLICFMCGISLMVTFLMRYKSNPTRINVDSNFGPIRDLTFPAIILCNTNFFTESQANVLIKTFELDDVELQVELAIKLRMITGFTTATAGNFTEPDYSYVQDILVENRYDTVTAMKKIMYPCNKMLYRCRWEGNIVPCSSLFQTTETYQGYCCGFNVLHTMLQTGKGIAQKPKKTQYFGPDNGLSVVLNPIFEKNAITSVNSEGVAMMLNNYDLYPGKRSKMSFLPHQQETFVDIRPERTECSNQVKDLPVSDRGCIFDNEFRLKFFPKYSEENCKIECLMLQTIKYCECLPYFYYNTQNIEVCNFLKIPCLTEHYDILNNSANMTCNCPTQCNGEVYEVRVSSSAIRTDMTTLYDPFHFGLTEKHMIVHVYFQSQVYRIFSRSLLTNIIGLIANLGGVYSLLIGMSVLSLCEVLYFASIRLYVNYKTIKKDELKPKTFSQRLETFDKLRIPTISLSIPRLDTAKSSNSSYSARKMTSQSHY
ncbi:unnamed protein product [Diamesa hyperborea]